MNKCLNLENINFKMDSKHFKEYLEELFQCPFCLETIKNAPIYQCFNGHIVCPDCHLNIKTCPFYNDAQLCDEPMSTRNLKLEEILKR